MTANLYLNRGVTACDLLSGTDGLQLHGAWEPKVASPTAWGPGPVTETLQVIAAGATHDALATVLQNLHTFQRWATAYWADPGENTPVWLYAQLTTETGERRSLVRKIDCTFLLNPFDAETAVGNQAEITLTIEREPYWESIAVAPTTLTAPGGVSVAGGVSETFTVAGDAPARLGQLRIISLSLSAGDYSKVWIGFRSSDRHSAAADFDAHWEAPAWTMDTDTTLAGDAADCDFATEAGWARRASWTIEDVVALGSVLPIEGVFLALAYAYVPDGTVVDVQVRTGFTAHITQYGEITPLITSTAGTRTLTPLGLLHIPSRDLHAVGADIEAGLYEWFELWARRRSGADDLLVNGLVLIPADEMLLAVDNALLTDTATNILVLNAAPEGQIAGDSKNYYAGPAQYLTVALPEVAYSGVGIGPGAECICVIAATLPNGQTWAADTVDMDVYWHTRYLSLRGASA